jgi:Ca2+-binding EF-hand superfamily protein
MSDFSEKQLQEAVDATFAQYGTNKNGTLERSEVYNMLNDMLGYVKSNRTVSEAEVNTFMGTTDTSHDGKIQREEVVAIFRKFYF